MIIAFRNYTSLSLEEMYIWGNVHTAVRIKELKRKRVRIRKEKK